MTLLDVISILILAFCIVFLCALGADLFALMLPGSCTADDPLSDITDLKIELAREESNHAADALNYALNACPGGVQTANRTLRAKGVTNEQFYYYASGTQLDQKILDRIKNKQDLHYPTLLDLAQMQIPSESLKDIYEAMIKPGPVGKLIEDAPDAFDYSTGLPL